MYSTRFIRCSVCTEFAGESRQVGLTNSRGAGRSSPHSAACCRPVMPPAGHTPTASTITRSPLLPASLAPSSPRLPLPLPPPPSDGRTRRPAAGGGGELVAARLRAGLGRQHPPGAPPPSRPPFCSPPLPGLPARPDRQSSRPHTEGVLARMQCPHRKSVRLRKGRGVPAEKKRRPPTAAPPPAGPPDGCARQHGRLPARGSLLLIPRV